MLEKLRELNERMIIKYSDNIKEKNKYLTIKKLLSDDKCFFKMDIEDAYALLRELNFDEDKIKEIYKELIDSSNFS